MSRTSNAEPKYDAIVIGSGFGGTLAAYALVAAKYRVLMLERGSWIQRGPHNWSSDATVYNTPAYSFESPYRVVRRGRSQLVGTYSAVGGPSVYYGGVSIRFRERDFLMDSDIAGDSGAHWPLGYAELEPYYTRAERILGVAGKAGDDPTEPARSAGYPAELPELSPVSEMVAGAAGELGLHPFRLPLAINYDGDSRQGKCIACATCDTFACAIQAKNDLATRVLPDLIDRGLELRDEAVVTKLVEENGRIVAVDCHDKRTGAKHVETARVFVLSAGALGSPHLILASDLVRRNPGGHTVGRYLMRHCSAIAFGYFKNLPEAETPFHKQLGINDLYFGHTSVRAREVKLGNIQQVQTPPVSLVKETLPRPLGRLFAPAVPHTTGLLVMAEDQPQRRNRVAVDLRHRDRFGLPRLDVEFRHSSRDRQARRTLLKMAKKIMRRAGAILFYVHRINTFSHAVGTVRMGDDPETSALDPVCRFRGIPNLFVVDGSFMPRSAGLNPSLTIAANGLRVGEAIDRVLADG